MTWDILVGCVVIVIARIGDVSLGTMRTVAVVSGHRGMAWIFGLLEVSIWVFVSFVAPGGISDPSILPGCQIFFAGAIRACWFLNAMHGLITPTGVYGNITGGTSAATAHASGVAALVIHAAGGNITPAQVEARMRDAAVDLGQPGKDAVFGHGRISAAAALEP
jgi:subtilisin family serine protease